TTYKPMRLTQQMFADTAKNMLERQVNVQVLQWDDEGVMVRLMDSLFTHLASGKLKVNEIAAALPDTYFEGKNPCCNFLGEARDIYWLRFAVKNSTLAENFLVEV